MTKKLLCLVLALMLITAQLTASAAPLLIKDRMTAYLGADNRPYLDTSSGGKRVANVEVADLLALAQTRLYVRLTDGSLATFSLNGGPTLTPSEANIVSAQGTSVFTLENGVLTLNRKTGTPLQITVSAQIAAANWEKLFYTEPTSDGSVMVRSVLLSSTDAGTAMDITSIPANAVSMTATDNGLAFVFDDRSILVLVLETGEQMRFPAESDQTDAAMFLNDTVYRYAQNEEGHWILEGTTSFIPATPVPTPTPVPTEEPYPRLAYGDRGEAVRQMQRRLQKLGYPVGRVDGVWGKNTQLAVNLFQSAIRYSERSYATSRMQELLYSRSAPAYDRYRPLKPGNEGTPVRLMQQALFDLGFLGTDHEEVDGIYGPITEAAVLDFQTVAGKPLLPTGKADADTLKLLFSTMAPLKPKPSDGPTDPNYPEFITPAPSNSVKPPVEETVPPTPEESTSPDVSTESPAPTASPAPTDALVELITPKPKN